jgi:dTDP-4-amino-4,6-dideoxygalactose transaminase
MIPHSRPLIDENDIKAVEAVIKSYNLSEGRHVKRFEEEVAKYIGVKGGVALNSGTSALHLALLSLNIKKGDEVIIPSYVCTALLNAIRYVGAIPIISDIEEEGYNIAPYNVSPLITKNTKAIIVPHLFGLPAEIDKFLEFGIPIIEDIAQAFGAEYKGKNLGSYGILSIVSFYATKVITTGEGGMVLSDSEELLENIRDIRNYDNKEDYKVRYNYKMTDFQASLGLSQLKKLPYILKRRRNIANRYIESLEGLPISLPRNIESRDNIYYRFVIGVKNIDSVIKDFWERGIECKKPIFKPIHHYLGLKGFKNSEYAYNSFISIPIYPSLSDNEVEKISEESRVILWKAGPMS